MSAQYDHNKNAAFKRGPNPLSVHIGLAMAEYRSLVNKGGASDDGMLVSMLDGIRKYHDHPYRRPEQSYREIWRCGEVRLLRRSRVKRGGSPLLVVPSLINKSAIFDLMPRRSFLQFLEGRGHDAILLDWGDPVRDPGMANCGMLMTERLLPALCAMREYAGVRPDVLGYCMGGLLLLGACCAAPGITGKIVLLGTPWDFHAGDGKMLGHVAAGTPVAFHGMNERGYLPKTWLQSLFAAMNAGRAARKFAAFAALDQDSAKAKLFVAVEDWLNDGADLPAGLARCCIAEWYGENRPASGKWIVAGNAVDPAVLENHILVVAGGKDRLVPPESSMALMKQAPHAELLTPDVGHIGMMAGQGAKEKVWEPVADWLGS